MTIYSYPNNGKATDWNITGFKCGVYKEFSYKFQYITMKINDGRESLNLKI